MKRKIKKKSRVSVKKKLHARKYGNEDMEDRDEFLFGPRVLSSRRSQLISQETVSSSAHGSVTSRRKALGFDRSSEPVDVLREIQAIKERNIKVEMDKAWETSWERRGVITIITYIIAGMWLFIIRDTDPWLKALVPSVGYFLSTVSIFFIRSWWMSRKIGRSSVQYVSQHARNKDFGSSSNTNNPPPII